MLASKKERSGVVGVNPLSLGLTGHGKNLWFSSGNYRLRRYLGMRTGWGGNSYGEGARLENWTVGI